MLKTIDCEQNSPEWYAARTGVITASSFKDVLAKGRKNKDDSFAPSKTRRTYMMKLAGERITGEPTESYSNGHMERGHDHEPIARSLYSESTESEVVEVGFMVNGPYGFSPDGLIGDDGLVEFKSKLPHIQAELLLSDKVPSEHRAQIQGGMFVSGRQWVDFVSYYPNMPMFVRRVERDEEYIANLAVQLAVFEDELQEIVKLLREKF